MMGNSTVALERRGFGPSQACGESPNSTGEYNGDRYGP